MRSFAAFATGVVFAAGLGLSGMTRPDKVIGFLDVFGGWDPSLAFVMGGAIAVHFLFFRLLVWRGKPFLAPRLMIPTRRDIDTRLVAGAVLFGAGWGLAGYCPGPGLVSAAAGLENGVVFVLAMLVGMAAFHSWDAMVVRVESSAPDQEPGGGGASRLRQASHVRS